MKKLLQITLLLAAMWLAPAAHAFTDQLHPVTSTFTSGTTTRVTANPTAGWGMILVMGNQNQTSGGSTSCCNGGCTATWTKLAGINSATRGSTEIWGCTNATGGSLAMGATWSSSCSAGPTCFARFAAASSTGTINAINAGTDGCTTSGTTQNPVECSPTNTSTSTFTGISLMFAQTASACKDPTISWGTCTFPNGNAEGYRIGGSYAVATWTGSASGAYTEAAGFLTETAAATAHTMPPAVY